MPNRTRTDNDIGKKSFQMARHFSVLAERVKGMAVHLLQAIPSGEARLKTGVASEMNGGASASSRIFSIGASFKNDGRVKLSAGIATSHSLRMAGHGSRLAGMSKINGVAPDTSHL